MEQHDRSADYATTPGQRLTSRAMLEKRHEDYAAFRYVDKEMFSELLSLLYYYYLILKYETHGVRVYVKLPPSYTQIIKHFKLIV